MTLNIDSHQHFWSLERGDYDWLTPDDGMLYRDYGPVDLAPLLSENGIDKTIIVQAAASVDETHYLLDLAERFDFVAGVVGWINMEDSETAAEVLRELAQHRKFVGIRPMIQLIDDPTWIAKPKLATAAEALNENDLCLDALVTTIHIPYLLKFIERHPELRIVINHGAKPDIGNKQWQPWADGISKIAAHSSVYCKLSGLINEAGPTQSYEDVFPYLDHLLDVFGSKRLMWGSDWPVLNLAGDYQGWHDAFEIWLSKLPAEDRTLIKGQNATRFYGLYGN